MTKTSLDNPLITVIITVYKVEKFLDACVQSVRRQTYRNLEILLVDDGSPDNCPALCDAYAKEDPRVKVIHKENGGVSDARNAGVANSTGEYIAFVDADDYVKDTYIEYLLGLFDYAKGNCMFTACNHIIVRRGNETPNFSYQGIQVLNQYEAFHGVLYHDKIDESDWAKLYRREIFDGLLYPTGKLYDDTHIFGHLIERSPEIVCGYEPQYYYIMWEGSIVHRPFSASKLDYFPAVKELTDAAEAFDPSLHQGCLRRTEHAYLSVLRQMKDCPAEFLPKRKELVKEARELGKTVLKDPLLPKRDRIALRLLNIGYFAFINGWELYQRFRK